MKLIKRIESKVVLIKLLVLVVKAEVEAVEEDVLEDVLLKDDVVKAVVFKVVLLQACLLEVGLVQALGVKVGLFQAAALVKVGCIEAGFLKALLLLATVKGLSHATAKLKLIKVKAGKFEAVNHVVGEALWKEAPP